MNGPELVAFAAHVRRFWSRRGIPHVLLDDAEQQAALVALEGYREKGLDLASARAWHVTAAIRQTGIANGRADCPLSIPDRVAAGQPSKPWLKPITRPTKVSIHGLDPSGAAFLDARDPESLLIRGEQARAAAAALARLAARARGMTRTQRAAVRAALGGSDVASVRGLRRRVAENPEAAALAHTALTGEDAPRLKEAA